MDIGILVAYPLLQRSHGIFRLHCFGTDEIGDFERGGNILEARGSCLFDLLIESSRAGSEPARHVEKTTAGIVKPRGWMVRGAMDLRIPRVGDSERRLYNQVLIKGFIKVPVMMTK